MKGKFNKKKVLCLAMCLVMMMGVSTSALAASGKVSYGNYNITYTTSSTNVSIRASATGDAYYKFKGSACCTKKTGDTIKKCPIEAGNSIAKWSSFTATGTPYSGYKFTNDYRSYNKMSFMRTTNLNNGFSTLVSFSYTI